MPFERSYRVLAYPLRIVASRRTGAFLHRFLMPFQDDVGPGAPVYELRREPTAHKPWAMYLDGVSLHRGRTASRILEFALWDISTKAIASEHGFLAVHAAAASWDGSGMVFPAPPESGKSTLVAGLTRAGCAYLTDEAALIDPASALVHPFPRSLWLARPSLDVVFGSDAARMRWATGRQFHVRPNDLRPGAIGGPCPVRFVIAPRYEGGATTRLEPMARAEAVMTLARNAFHLERFGGAGIELLARVAVGASCYRLRIGDLDEAVRSVLRIVKREEPVGTASAGEAITTS